MRCVVVLCSMATVACGPSVPVDPAGTTSTTSEDASDTSTPTPTTTPTPTDESTSRADTSTSTSAGTSTGTTSDDDDGGGFIFPKPDGGSCFTSCIECDLWAQDCMKGQKCMPSETVGSMAWDSADCFDIARDPGAPGDPCFVEGDQWSGLDDCQISAMCWDTDPETNAGTCVGFCLGSQANPVCGDGESCFSAYDGNVILCLPECDPLGWTCAEGFACVKSSLESQGFACIPASLVTDRDAYADTCDDIVGCGSGLVCVDAEHVPGCDTEKCCSLLCDPLAGNGCPELARGQYCVPFEEQPELGYCGF
jgi:hypothetical protein